MPGVLARVFGACIARGVSTGGAIEKVTAALVEGGVAERRASGIDWDGADATVTPCAGEVGVAESCVAAPATVGAAFGEYDAAAFASTTGAAGCTTAGELADAAGDATGGGGVRAGICDDATMRALLARFDASVGGERDAMATGKVVGRDALLVRASCPRRVESAGRAFDARATVGGRDDAVRALDRRCGWADTWVAAVGVGDDAVRALARRCVWADTWNAALGVGDDAVRAFGRRCGCADTWIVAVGVEEDAVRALGVERASGFDR